MRDFQLPGRSPVMSSNGMCATSHPLAAQAALDILKSGGSAMDAAIAGAVLLGICEPQSTGIGGDCFALVSLPGSSEVHAFNGSGRAPAAASAARLRDMGHTAVPVFDVEAITVPGAIDGFCQLSEKYGKLGIADSLSPAIHYADAGVPVAPRAGFDWGNNGRTLQGHGRTHFMNNDKPYSTGQLFKAPGQAEVLRRIAKEGRDAFYTGEIAEDMVATLNALGGVHTMEDFADSVGTDATPVSGTYKDVELIEHPPNGQGAVAILMLNILKHFDIASMDPFGTQRAHIEAEAAKLAYDARDRFIADPDSTTRLDHLLSEETAAKLAALIDPKKALPHPAPLTEAVHKDTVYITVVDKDRMAVSLIYSIFHAFGSGIASEKFGILMQNRGGGFTLQDGHPNELGPNKRPMHTIIPGMTRRNGVVEMPFGVMGGHYQPNGHARVLTNIEDFGMDAQEALDAPRSFAEDGVLKVERGYSDTVRQDLADLGHTVEIPPAPLGGAQAIQIHPDGYLIGASDPRKDGAAIGY
ncbi:putative gamma-glutamyltransferase YwrD [Shimia sp. SK013]|uniref:gamma-glutamyltransferase family protein n=1 Tax=Shimia sp. SK013 TaxID=1389006 RepID=UPI0006B4AC25|nr:gamma-glutamyltransferase family protein [Shimia sp. SK013]KPA21167.1 putative gamma-glutamyltransferase YwrD [Shimia sp. SK013]